MNEEYIKEYADESNDEDDFENKINEKYDVLNNCIYFKIIND